MKRKNTRMISGRGDQLEVDVFKSSHEMGKRTALAFAQLVQGVLEVKEKVRCVFAAAPSQNQFLDYLVKECSVDWSKFDRVPIGHFHALETTSQTIEELCDQYSKLLSSEEVDIVVMGIGENGHIAFNDPPVADFQDPLIVKAVELDQACRLQQVNDGAFVTFEDVPTHAVTTTIPALLNTKSIICIVPGKGKSEAVLNALSGPIEETCPASIVRTCAHATLYLDRKAFSECQASLLEPQ